MKRIILLSLVLGMSLGVVACSKNEPEKQKYFAEDGRELTEEEMKQPTPEEVKEIHEKMDDDISENIKYRFAKITASNGTKIEVEYVNTPDGYKDKGYNEKLDIDTSNLKPTGETNSVELVGVSSNIMELDEIKEGSFVRIGIYERESGQSEFDFKQGDILAIDII